jgi:hypothetical protein
MLAVVSMLSTSFCAVPDLRRVEPARTGQFDPERPFAQSGSKDPDTGLRSGISDRTKRATTVNRSAAKGPISLNGNSTRTKPTPARSKDAKASPGSSDGRPQPTDADAHRAKAPVARGKTKSAAQPIRSPKQMPKQDVAASEPVPPPLEPKPRRGAQTIAAKWTKWKKQKARHS